MVDEVNIVFEGDSRLRPGFRNLLDRHVERARNQRIRFRLIAGGARAEAGIRGGLPGGGRRRRTYSKVSDGARLLELIDETIVGQRCRHFRRLMGFLDGAF